MVYLIDACTLIHAHMRYYPLDRVPEFWGWLEFHASDGRVQVPSEIYDELQRKDDDIAAWVRDRRNTVILAEEANGLLLRRVINDGYAPDLTDVEVVKIGRDPFLIAYALADVAGRCIVTAEVSRPRAQRANRQIPDVAMDLGVRAIDPFQFIRELDFSTSWQQAP